MVNRISGRAPAGVERHWSTAIARSSGCRYSGSGRYRRGEFLAKSREVRLTPDQEAFIRQAIDTGRFHREEDVVQEALSLLEERERERAEFLSTLDDAKASLARGEGRIITQQSMRELSDEVKRRGLGRIATEQPAPR
jgi:putative addiction module CopG family antidote